MSLESAQQFVSRMKEDKEFRIRILQTDDSVALNVYLRGLGFEFNQRQLVGAMAECMADLDAMAQG